MSGQRRRDADEEALQEALHESMQTDYMAEILRSEAVNNQQRQPRNDQPVATFVDTPNNEETDVEEDLSDQLEASLGVWDDDTPYNDADNEEEDSDMSPEEVAAALAAKENAKHAFLNLPDVLLLSVLRFVDEDTIGECTSVCHRLHAASTSEALAETLCRRIYPSQNARAAALQAAKKFAPRKFRNWRHMFIERPRVRHHGLYYLKVFYFKNPELNMWTPEITPGTVLQVVYYRYFSFQRDGSVIYAMLFKPPHEAIPLIRNRVKNVHEGTYSVEKDEVHVKIPMEKSTVEFRFNIKHGDRGHHALLQLEEHNLYSTTDRTGFVERFETFHELLPFYRAWDL